jgi:hypothetical protein
LLRQRRAGQAGHQTGSAETDRRNASCNLHTCNSLNSLGLTDAAGSAARCC